MIRVLQCVNDMHRAGLETMLMNYYRSVDRTQIQFDFLTHRPHRGDFDEEIESMGGVVYYAPRLYPQNYPTYFRWMAAFFKNHPEYRLVHSHIDAMSFLPLLAADRAGIPVRIAHSHSTGLDMDIKYPIKLLFKSQLCSVCNYRLACGDAAGRFLFGDRDFTVIPNAVDSEKFLFNEDIRQKKRSELGISTELVVGHVGRITYAKNHKFLIDVFIELLKRKPDAVLLIVGTGEKEGELKERVRALAIEDRVRMLGNRSDVNELYQAMDLFMLPSFYEGVPLVGVEAQYAGLPCIFSDKVPEEVKFSENCRFVSINQGANRWADILIESCAVRRNAVHYPSRDIREASRLLSELYAELAGRNVQNTQ